MQYRASLITLHVEKTYEFNLKEQLQGLAANLDAKYSVPRWQWAVELIANLPGTDGVRSLRNTL